MIHQKLMKKIILHIDFDSYFASCEQQFDPKLRGKPIGVTAQNGRTCIIAASREAKKLGVKSPSRTWEAIRMVPGMVFVPAHFGGIPEPLVLEAARAEVSRIVSRLRFQKTGSVDKQRLV